MNKPVNENLQEKVNLALDKEVLELETSVRSKLNSIRNQALAQPAKTSVLDLFIEFVVGNRAMTATALSVLCVGVLVTQVSPDLNNIAGVDDLEMMQAIVDPVMMEEYELLEQLEFIAWLEQESVLEQIENEV